MTLDPHSIAALIDHTLLRPDATRADIVRICEEALEYRFASVCVNSYWTKTVADQLSKSAVRTCVVVGFPLGAMCTEAKIAETGFALAAGAREIDMVLNIGAMRGGDHDTVLRDIQGVIKASHAAGAQVKVILETALLDDAQKRDACLLAKAAGADFVKTSTGFGPAGATVQDVALMRATVGPDMGVKASGGIRTLNDVTAMVAAGATRIGASAGVAILKQGAAGGEATGY